jgi:hypothetical protein
MNYTASEADVKDSVNDLIVFCDYIERKKPPATAKGDLSTKACYEINTLLRYPQNDVKTTDRMYQYISIPFWFHIAKEAGLISCEPSKGGKNAFVTTEKYSEFKALNLFSQYLTIFHVWYCYVNVEALNGDIGFNTGLCLILDKIFAQLAESSYKKWIKRVERIPYIFAYGDQSVQVMMLIYYKTACQLRDLGFVEFSSQPVIDKLRPTALGVLMSRACAQRSFSKYNVYAGGVSMTSIWDDAANEDEKTPLFITPFLDCFPQGSIDLQGVINMVYDRNSGDDGRVFDFTVSLGKKCYRIIRCSPEHTFEDLHLAIQDAFEFDNDHLYSFFLDGRMYSEYSVNSPHSEKPPYTDETYLKDERLFNNQRILYLFDYGDEWEFSVVLAIKRDASEALEPHQNPQIIKSVGESPEQYPYYG